MLILSRKAGETIVIGDGIEVRIIEIRGDKCRIGISAPRDVAVNRLEVHQRIQSEADKA